MKRLRKDTLNTSSSTTFDNTSGADMKIWKIFARLPAAYEDSEDYARECYRSGIIALGWNRIGNLNSLTSREELKRMLARKYRNEAENTIAQWAGSLWSFKTAVRPGHIVVCPDRESRRYYVGRVESPRVSYNKEPLGGRCDFAHRRKVKWLRVLTSRQVESLWPDGRFGGNQTVSQIRGGRGRLRRLISKGPRVTASRRRLPLRPDMEWGRAAEERAMVWLGQRGYAPKDVSNLNIGWDITCGDDKFEIKGRKSCRAAVRLTQNEWRASRQWGARYTVLIFTAATPQQLKKAQPIQIPDPTRTESWRRRISYEYVLAE